MNYRKCLLHEQCVETTFDGFNGKRNIFETSYANALRMLALKGH